MGPKQSQTIAPVDNTNIDCGGHAYCNGGKHSSHNKAASQHAKLGVGASFNANVVPVLQNLILVNDSTDPAALLNLTYNATLRA